MNFIKRRRLLNKWVRGSYRIVNGVVNADGNVCIRDWEEDRLPVQFGTVTGNFDCSHNQLTSLEGAPRSG